MMARKSVRNSEARADYSIQGIHKPDSTAAIQPASQSEKFSSSRFAGLSPAVQAERQLSLDFGAEQAFSLIHGGHSYHVAVCQKTAAGTQEEKWHQKIVAHHMAQFAAVAVGGMPDCYMSQHGCSNRRRNIEEVQALTSCAIDMDYYKIPALAQLSPVDVLARIKTNLPWLPSLSALVSSGQGFYLEWVFDEPLPASRLCEWQAVMDALIETLEPWGADSAARAASQVLRIVNSVNSKSGRTVTVLEVGQRVQFEAFRCAVLDGLALARQAAQADNQPDSITEPKSNATGQHRTPTAAQRAQAVKPYELALARLTDYRTLAQLRGNPKLTDYRHRMLFCFAVSMCWFVSDRRDVIAECEQFAADYFAGAKRYTARRLGSVLERLEQRDMARIWNGRRVANRYKLRNDTIIRMLDITADEMQHMKTLINGEEKQRRRVERRRAAGMVERGEYLADAEQRRQVVMNLRKQGMKASVIASELGMARSHVYRILAAAQRDMFDDGE
jgi:hypothetical protein